VFFRILTEMKKIKKKYCMSHILKTNCFPFLFGYGQQVLSCTLSANIYLFRFFNDYFLYVVTEIDCPGVNFTTNLLAHFSYKILASKITKLKCN